MAFIRFAVHFGTVEAMARDMLVVESRTKAAPPTAAVTTANDTASRRPHACRDTLASTTRPAQLPSVGPLCRHHRRYQQSRPPFAARAQQVNPTSH